MNWKWFFFFLFIAIELGLSVALGLWTPVSAYYYVQQGDTVYVNQTVDISGVTPPYDYLAYWDGFDMYEGNASYLLALPSTDAGYYNFNITPAIFGNRLGKWFRVNVQNGYAVYEPNGNNLAFVVRPERKTPLPLPNETNASLQNPNQTPIVLPKQPVLPIKHVSDYLIARGDGLKLSFNGSTSVWVFGTGGSLLDYQAFNGTVDITPKAINTLQPGNYKILIQSHTNGTSTVRYNNATGSIQWFDPGTFTIQEYSIIDQTPENILQKLEEVFPVAGDTYMVFNLEIQDPTISIDEIDVLNQLNDTGAPQSQGVTIGAQNYIDVRGYTNAAPDTLIYAVPDADFNNANPWKNAIITSAQGDLGGDMREWKIIIPVNLEDMAIGTRHFVYAKTELSNTTITSGDFYIYGNPSGNVIPNKTIKYISGRYGPEEMVPTPTPVIVTHEVTKVVTQVVTVPVTPSNEQVLAQQKIAQQQIADQNWNRNLHIFGISFAVIMILLIVGWMISAWRRSKI